MDLPSSPSSQSSVPSVFSRGSSSRRRAQGSSSESNPDTYTLCRSIGRLDLRELRPLPGLVSRDAAPYLGGQADSIVSRLEGIAEEVLSEHNIRQPDSVEQFPADFESTMDTAFEYESFEPQLASLVLRGYDNDQSTMRLTLLVVADWEDDEWTTRTWEVAAYGLNSALGKALERFRPDFCVNIEFIATHLVRQAYAFPVTGQPALKTAWNENILPRLTRLVYANSNVCNHVNAIAMQRIGFDRDHPLENPLTVYVALENTCNEVHWPALYLTLTQYLGTLGHQIGLRIEHNGWDFSAFQPLPPKDLSTKPWDIQPYETRAPLGADIGCCMYTKSRNNTRYNSPLGTLGCYLQLKMPGEASVRTLALTNYHIVRPLFQGFLMEDAITLPLRAISPGTILYGVDRTGIRQDTAPSLGEMEHPTRTRHNRIVASQRTLIAREEDPEKKAKLQASLDPKIQFFDDNCHVLGKLFAASGFARRSASNKRLDWALIDVLPDRVGSNGFPDSSVWMERGNGRYKPALPSMNLKDPTSSLSQSAKGHNVYKMGAATGPTAGILHELKVHVGIRESRYVRSDPTNEYTVSSVTPGAVFGDFGDSGAIVYGSDAAALGLLFRGMPPKHTGVHLTLITPIEDVFADIKALTGAEWVRVA